MAVNNNRFVNVIMAEFDTRIDGLVPVIALSASAQSAIEGNAGASTTINFPVTRSRALTRLDQVNYVVTPSGSNPASASDFVGGVFPSGSVIFGIGETSTNIPILVAGDATVELAEGFTVTITLPGIGELGNATATGSITNDDTASVPTPSPSLTLSSALTYPEGNSGTAAFVWTLTLNRDGSTASFPFMWAVAGNGTSPAEVSDFGGTYPIGSGTFAPGETTKQITVLVTGDTAVEPNETFLLTVTANGLNTVTSTGTISNDDVAQSFTPSLDFSDARNSMYLGSVIL